MQHLVDGIHIVLQVGIHGDHAVGAVAESQKTAQQRVLVTAVARELQTGKCVVFAVERFNERPSVVRGAVVYEADAALR